MKMWKFVASKTSVRGGKKHSAHLKKRLEEKPQRKTKKHEGKSLIWERKAIQKYSSDIRVVYNKSLPT